MFLSIVILSWNRKDEMILTLKDLYKQKFKNFEIIIVDQGSSDGTPENIRKEFPEIKLIKLDRNLGVPGGRNIGANSARGDAVVFLDNDASLKEDALGKIVEKFASHEKLGIIGFKIMNQDGSDLDYSSWVYPKNLLEKAKEEWLTYTFCGAGHAIKKEIFEKIGYYWDELFFSWEEMELSLRVLDGGYDILYSPEIVAYHRSAVQNRVSGPVHECRRLRNSLWVFWRAFPLGYACWITLVRISAYLIKGMRCKCLLKMIFYAVSSFSKFYLCFDKQNKISKEAFLKYKKMSHKGSIIKQVRTLVYT